MFGTTLAARVACCWRLLLVPHPLDLSSCFMFQCNPHCWCCACTAAVLKCYGLVVQSPPPVGGNRHDIGGRLQRGGGRYWQPQVLHQNSHRRSEKTPAVSTSVHVRVVCSVQGNAV